MNHNPIVVVLLFVIVFIGVFGMLAYFTFKSNNKNVQMIKEAPFQQGDVIKMKAFGNIGMIINVKCERNCNGVCTYSVRFPIIKSSTKDHFIGSGGDINIAPISIVKGIRAYEIELY